MYRSSSNHQISSAATPIAPSRDQNFYTTNYTNSNHQNQTPNHHHQQQNYQNFNQQQNHSNQNHQNNQNHNNNISTTSSLQWNTTGNHQNQNQSFQQQQQEQFLLVVNTVDGKKYKLVSRTSDIRNLSPLAIKRFVKMVAHIPEDVQILRFGGNILGDHIAACGEVGITSGDVIALDDLRMYTNNDQVQRVQEQQHQQKQQQQQYYYSGNLSYPNDQPPQNLQDLSRGFYHSNNNPSHNQQNNSGAFFPSQEQHLHSINNNNTNHATTTMTMRKPSPAPLSSSSSSAVYQQQQQQQQPLPTSPPVNYNNAHQAATSIIQMQKRLLEKEAELKQQQEMLQRILQEATERESKKLDESTASTMRELASLKEEMKKVELQATSASRAASAALDTASAASAASSRQGSVAMNHTNNHNHQQNFSNNNNNNADDDENDTSSQPVSPRGSALGSSNNNNINNNSGSFSPPQVKKQPTFTPPPMKKMPPPMPKTSPKKPTTTTTSSSSSPSSDLVQDAMRIAATTTGGNSSSSFAHQNQQATNNTTTAIDARVPLKERAYKLVVAAVKKLILHSLISSETISDETLNRDTDTWTIDLLMRSASSKINNNSDDDEEPSSSSSVNSLLFSYDEESQRLYLYTTLLHFIPSDPHLKLALYEFLLEGALMGREMAGGGVGVSARSNLVLMATSIDVRFCGNYEAMAEIVENFVESAKSWSSAATKILHGNCGIGGQGRRTASY